MEVLYLCFVRACKNSLIKKNVLFHAKVIFLESATLHLKNQTTQMQKWKAFKVLAARFWMGVCSSCSFSHMITGNSTRIEKFSKCYSKSEHGY